MKQLFRYISVVVMLFTSMAVSAQSTIKVMTITNGTLTTDKNSASKNETVTITVTPSEGYYFQKENLEVVKTVNPASTRGDIPIAGNIAVSGSDPADLSVARSYTFIVPDDGYVFQVSATFTARTTISESMVSLSATSFTYNGSDQKPTVSVTGLTEGTDYTVSFAESAWKEVGTYSVNVSGKSTYKGTVTKTFTISAADCSLTPPTGKTNLIYTGSAQDLIEAGSSTTGTMQYSLDGTNYSTEIPQGTDAKEYIIYYKVVANAGYNDVAPALFKVTISPKTVNSPTITLSETNYTYDGNAKEPTVTVKDGDATIPASEYTVSYKDNTEVGTATVTITDKEGGNYTVSGSVAFSITAPETPSVVNTDESVTVDGQELYEPSKEVTEAIKEAIETDIALPQKAEGRVEVTEGGGLKFSKGEDLLVGLLDMKLRDIVKFIFTGRLFGDSSKLRLKNASTRGTRAAGDMELISEAEYEVIEAGDQVVTVKLEEGEATVETIAITESEKTPITIGKSGKASYCGDQSLDFSFSDEVKAYIATGFDKDEGTIWLTRVKDVPAGVPVLIKGDANKTYDVPVTDSQNSYYTNMFVGNTTGEKMVIQERDGDMVNYYLSGDGTFKSVNKTANIGTNKCYLQLPGTFEAAVTGATQTVKVGSIGKASFAAPVDLDFTNVSGLKAFTATGYDKITKTIWLTRVMKVQKGEGVLLKGDPDNYEIPSAAVQSSYENMFVGNTSGDEIQVQETSEDGSQTNYYLSGKDGSFVSVSGYAKIGDNKCYLALPTSMVAVSSTRSAEDDYKFEEPEVIKLPIDFKSIGSEGDGTTSIREVKSGEVKGEEWYTLQGQRVAKPGKGLYIKNGKKVVIK